MCTGQPFIKDESYGVCVHPSRLPDQHVPPSHSPVRRCLRAPHGWLFLLSMAIIVALVVCLYLQDKERGP